MNPARGFLVVSVAAVVSAVAQKPENAQPAISADRPGFATSPGVLGPGLAQVEGGFTFSVDGDGPFRGRTLTFGSPLIRFGAGGPVELRVAGDGYLFRRNESLSHERTTGWSDLSVGAKVAVVRERRGLPAISLLPSISVPAGYKAFTSSTYDPGLTVSALKTLAAGVSVVGAVTGTRISEAGMRHARYSSAIALSFPGPAQSVGYIETYAVTSLGPDSDSARIYDAGLSRSLGTDLQIDVQAGRRLYSGRPCWFVGTGFAWRHAVFRR